jgi:peptidoglycan/LPS O-acetylase OafA/YrhL
LSIIEKSIRFQGIESLRAFAAIAIILFHLPSAGGAALPESLGFIASHFGFGVPLFFVVSGFSLAHGYYGGFSTRDLLRNYYTRRFFRIAPLFYAVLIYQLLSFWFLNHLTVSPVDVIINATFTFNLIPRWTDGIVPASWTIGVEMIFYLLFPLLLLFLDKGYKIFLVLCLAIMLSSKFSIDTKLIQEQVPSFIYHNFLTNFPYFIWGMFGYSLFRILNSYLLDFIKPYLGWLFCLVAFFCIYTLYSNSTLYMYFWNKGLRTTWDSLWGIPFVLLCIGVALYPVQLISNFVSQYLGKISFSLYLIHPTVVYHFGKLGVYSWIYNLSPENKLLGFLLSALFVLIIITAMATVTFFLIEKPGISFGKKLTLRNNV